LRYYPGGTEEDSEKLSQDSRYESLELNPGLPSNTKQKYCQLYRPKFTEFLLCFSPDMCMRSQITSCNPCLIQSIREFISCEISREDVDVAEAVAEFLFISMKEHLM
jgi:hypothetical protein